MSRRRTRVELRKHRPVVAIVAAVQQGNHPLLAAGYGLGLSQLAGEQPDQLPFLFCHRREARRDPWGLRHGPIPLRGFQCGVPLRQASSMAHKTVIPGR